MSKQTPDIVKLLKAVREKLRLERKAISTVVFNLDVIDQELKKQIKEAEGRR